METQPLWYYLEQGKRSFRNVDYVSALMSFEDARRHRRAKFERMERDFINLLSVNQVRRLGDSLDWVERYARERFYHGAIAALEELYFRVPRASLNNSAAAALEALGRLKDYPEAEFWIGEVYRVEGELSLALSQFRRAYASRELFENQDFDIDLQYRIASILRTRQEYNEFERVLHSIIMEKDTLWSNIAAAGQSTQERLPYVQASASFAGMALNRILENEGPNRLLYLYRYDNNRVEEAHRLLGLFYAATGRPSAQQHLTFAFLIQNSTIIAECMRRQYDFTFTNLSALAEEINRNPLLASYVRETEYYKTAYFLAVSLYRNGRTNPALELWDFLAGQPQAGEWRNRSIRQLRNPYLEPIVEMP
jgi:tetratricopeptide (TPR) repeat protein